MGSSDHYVWDGTKNIHYAQQTRQITNVAAGKEDTDAVNVAQLKQVVNLVNNGGGGGTSGSGVHDYSVKSINPGTDTNYNNGGASGDNALAAGVSASAKGENAVAIGTGATAEGKGATVIGQYAKAKGDYATAFGGSNTDTTGEAVGNTADGANSVAFGERTSASGNNSTAFGWQTKATEKRATAFGERTTASGANSTAFGQLAVASGQNSTAFGNEAVANNYGSTAFGNRTEALGEYSTAFGNSTVAAGMNTVAFGTDNVAGAVLDGNGAYTNIIYKTNAKGRVERDANGNPIELSREKMDARGNLAYTDSNSNTQSVTYTVPGGETHSYVLLQGEDGNTYIRDYRGDIRSATIGTDGTVTVGDTALTNVTLKKANAGANGYHILSNANATAWGENSIASGEASTAFGIGSTASGKNSVAIGGATASLDDSIALGKGAVTTRAKYSALTKDEEKAAYAKGGSTGSVWEATDNAIAVGNDSTVTRQITGVAAGSLDTDAVNVAQLKAVDAKHTTVSVGGQKATADDTLVKGGNLELKRHTTDGQANYDVALSKDVILGEQEENKGGSLVVNSVAQFRKAPDSQETYPVKEAVKIDGTTVSVVKNDGTNDQRQVVLGVGQDTGGYVALFDKTGKTPTYIFNAISPGITYLKDSKTYPANEANEFKRLEYGDITNGSTQFIATLDDGLKFSGDQGTDSAVKLNQKLSVTGGETNPDNLVTASNIGVVSSQDGDNGKLEIKLNKDLTGLNTVTAGTAKIGHNADGVLPTIQNGQPTGGHAGAGDYVTGLTNKEWTVKNPTYVSGRAATEDELRTVSDAVSGNTTKITNNTTQITNNTNTIAKGLSFTTNTKDDSNTSENYKGYKVVKRSLGDTIAIKASDEAGGHDYSTANLTTRIAENGDISILMDEKPTFTTVTTDDVIYTGNKDQKDKDGKAAQADTSVHYGDKTLTDGKNITTSDNETKSTRLGYQDAQGLRHDIATMDDGQIYAGDIKTDGTADTTGFGRKMNEKTTINGGVKVAGNLTDGNIGVVSNGTDTLIVKLAKELKDLTSVTTGKTVQNDSGIKITNDANDETKNVVINGDKISYGGNQVTNMGSGLGKTYTTAGDNNGANIGDVKQIADGRRTTVKSTDGSVSVVDKNANDPKATSHDYDLSVDTSKVAEGVTLKYKGDNNTQGSNKLSEAVTFSGTANQIETKAENGKVTFSLADDMTTQTITANGKNGNDGQIGLTGKNGADGSVTTIIKTVGAKGTDGKDGIPGVDGQPGKDGITRLIYQDGKDGEEGTTTHTVATLDDGLKFHGDSGDIVTRKLNTQLDVLGGQTDTNKLTATTDGNIGVVSTKAADETSNGKLEIRLAKELKGLTSVQTGDTTVNDGGLTINKAGNGGTDSITINKTTVSLAGNQITNMGSGIDGTKYTDAGDNNGANIGDVKKLADSRKTTVKSTDGSVKVTNTSTDSNHFDYDLSVDTTKVAGAMDLKYKGDNNTQGSNKLSEAVTFSGTANQIVTKAENGKVTFKLADDLTTQTITANGKNGNDGQIGLTGKNGADGSVTTIIKTVGAKGTDGKDGIPGVDGQPGKDGITRLVYDEKDDKGGTEHHVVATLDDGLKFVGNDGKVVTRKLNDTLSIKGGIDDAEMLADAQRVSSRNLGVRQNANKDGLEIVMTDTPDFTKVTVGGDKKITIGGQTNSDTKNPANGNYITGLDNTKWDAGNVVADRAATEGQLSQAITDISGKDKGGFGLADEKGGTVKKNLGETIAVKGDGKNIETTVKDGALEVSLKKDVDLGKDGSIKAGETTIDKDGVKTNEVKVGDITITKDGINGGAKQITNIASGIDGKQYTDAGDNNAASIGDVKKIAGDEASKAADAVKSKSGKNITVKDDHTVNLNDNITLGDETDASKQVSIDGNNAKVTAGDGANKVTMDGSKGQVVIGTGDSTMTLGKQENKAGDSNPKEGNFLNGLDNRKWDGEHIQSGRAATEDQLKTVSDKVNSGRKFQGDDGQNVTVGMGDTLKIQGGVKAEDVSQENNIGIVKGADDTLNIRLAKDLKGLDSVTTGDTTINNSGLTVKGDDNHKAITIQQGNVNMGGNTISGVADGKVSKDSTDAVNGSQLWQRDQAINGLSGSVNKLGNRINRVGAGAAALAALHPLDFDPDDKWDFAAGYGNYRGANAAAIGAYYRPNEDTMFSVGGSFGGGENMVNAGVSIKLGQGNHVSTSRVAMAKEMKAMRQHMAEQDALIAKLQSMHGMAVDPAKSTLFPDVAENHWAYQYVTTLAKKGILEGYPDGEFKGDRMMTRYEFAAIVYRIVESGVGSTDPELSKLVKEFSPELQYIRIDTIQKDRNGKPTIERVRVISDAK